MKDRFFEQIRCDRCGAELTVRTMSRFNTDCICLKCADAEKHDPEYQRAVDAELAEIRKGNYNFKGIRG